MATRLMYGSDWFMVALHPDYEAFLDTYRQLFEGKFGTDRTAPFMGGTALRFPFGPDDSDHSDGAAPNQNAERLRVRYQQFAPDRMPDWL